MSTSSIPELIKKLDIAWSWNRHFEIRDILCQIRDAMTKKTAGRPELYPTKKLIGFDDAMLVRIEEWRGQQNPVPNLSDAIRALIEKGLEK